MTGKTFLYPLKISLMVCLFLMPMKTFAVEGNESRLRRNTSLGDLLQKESTTTPGNTLQRGSISTRDTELRQALNLVRDLKLVKELNLSQDKASIVLDKLRRVREIQNTYTQRRQSMIAQLEKIVNSPSPEQSELKAKLRELRELEGNYLSEKDRTKKEIYEVLSPEQRVQYILFQQKFRNELRKVITDIKKNNQAVNTPESGTSLQRPREGNVLQNRRR